MKNIYFLLFSVLLVFSSCDDWLDRDSKSKLTDDVAYNEVGMINSIIAGLYSRLPDTGGIDQTPSYYTELDEGMLGTNVNNFIKFNNDYLSYYYFKNESDEKDKFDYNGRRPYQLIRDINYHIFKLDGCKVITDTERRYYKAEARFLRAYVYFELVKRMGGVPIIIEPASFDGSGEYEKYYVARSKEEAVYDFIDTEVEAIKDDLDLTPFVQYNRASKGAALALKIRAMLYAGSLAKYNSTMAAPIALPGREVGIPGDRATGYYEAVIRAFNELEGLNRYGLYEKNSNKSDNFYEALTMLPEAGNNEAIFIKQYAAPSNYHGWTSQNMPRTLRNGGTNGTGGSFISPSLNLVDEFEMLDGTDGKLQTFTDPSHPDELDANPAAYRYFGSMAELFQGKDNRLAGTIVTPGATLGGKTLDIQAGIAYYNGNTNKFDFYTQGTFAAGNELMVDNKEVLDESGNPVRMTGADGPTNDKEATRTGFYVRKWMEPGTTAPNLQSTVPFIRFRYGEALLNAAEASFELNIPGTAVAYLNRLRNRAGFTKELTSTSIEQIRRERRVELAYEGQRYYDLRRWRVGHELFNGQASTPSAMIYGLWPYKVYRPGHETHNQWIFVRLIPSEFKNPRNFTRANYYSAFPADALNMNYKLIKNPEH